jgi:hypothetical protein
MTGVVRKGPRFYAHSNINSGKLVHVVKERTSVASLCLACELVIF